MNQYVKNYVAGGPVVPYRIIGHGTADGQVVQAVDGLSAFVGLSVIPETVTVAANERVDVGVDRFLPVEYGGVIGRGDPLTADAQGRAIVAEPGAGTNAHIIGYADVSGISGDIVDIYVRPARIQG